MLFFYLTRGSYLSQTCGVFYLSPLVRTITTRKKAAIELKFYEMQYRHIEPVDLVHLENINIGHIKSEIEKNDAKTLI